MGNQQGTASIWDGADEAVGIICAYNEERRIGDVVRTMREVPEIEQVVVVDGGSEDRTWERAEAAGADVVLQDELGYPGKGSAVATGLRVTRQEVLVYVDGDWKNLKPSSVRALVKPLVDGVADRTLATFERSAGRVTELTAKPLLKLYFPEIAVEQPLAGEYGMRRSIISDFDIVRDWGVEAGLLIDHAAIGAHTRLVDFGYKEHPMKDLHDLGPMAEQVARTILDRAHKYDRISSTIGVPVAGAAEAEVAIH